MGNGAVADVEKGVVQDRERGYNLSLRRTFKLKLRIDSIQCGAIGYTAVYSSQHLGVAERVIVFVM